MTTGKTITWTRWTFDGKVVSLLFNMLSRLVIAFLPRSKRLWISWLQSPSAVILEPPKRKSDTVSTVSPPISMKWWDQMPRFLFSECWALSQLFHSPLSLLSRGILVPLHFEVLGITYYLHCAWRAQSSGKVETANQFLKSVIKKVTQETFLG